MPSHFTDEELTERMTDALAEAIKRSSPHEALWRWFLGSGLVLIIGALFQAGLTIGEIRSVQEKHRLSITANTTGIASSASAARVGIDAMEARVRALETTVAGILARDEVREGRARGRQGG